jgi:hypothetical protein
MFFWAVLIGLVGLVASTTGGEGVAGSDPGRAAAINDYMNGQLITIAAVIALIIIGAAARSPQHRSIALTAWSIFLLDIGGLFLT